MINRITPNIVIKLESNEIFLFGSNEEGFHRRGAAKFALDHCGAILGQARGLQGQSYAIVTKKNFRVMRSSTLDEIRSEVDEFIEFSKSHPDLIFLVTKIGTDLAGYSIEDIAPMFIEATQIKNIKLPVEFWDIINEMNYPFEELTHYEIDSNKNLMAQSVLKSRQSKQNSDIKLNFNDRNVDEYLKFERC